MEPLHKKHSNLDAHSYLLATHFHHNIWGTKYSVEGHMTKRHFPYKNTKNNQMNCTWIKYKTEYKYDLHIGTTVHTEYSFGKWKFKSVFLNS